MESRKALRPMLAFNELDDMSLNLLLARASQRVELDTS